jgi:hypothetical protein
LLKNLGKFRKFYEIAKNEDTSIGGNSSILVTLMQRHSLTFTIPGKGRARVLYAG